MSKSVPKHTKLLTCLIVSKFDNYNDVFEKNFAAELTKEKLTELSLTFDPMDKEHRTLIEFLFGSVDCGLQDEDEEKLDFEIHRISKRLMKLIK